MGLSMFRALLALLQKVLHKPHLVYCVRVMSVGFTNWCSQLTQQRAVYQVLFVQRLLKMSK
jgi:hypothetical protein